MSSSPKSRLINGASGEEYVSWQPPRVRNEADTRQDAHKQREQHKLTADSLQKLQKQAYAEGFAQGREAGMQAAGKEIEGRLAHLDRLIQTLQTPLHELDENVIREMVELSFLIAKQLVRRELRTEAGQIVSVVREALALLPSATRNVRVLLHPEDAVRVREAFALSDHDQRWQVVEDAALTVGGCKIVSDNSSIDVSVESRLNAVIAQVLGGERETDQNDRT